MTKGTLSIPILMCGMYWWIWRIITTMPLILVNLHSRCWIMPRNWMRLFKSNRKKSRHFRKTIVISGITSTTLKRSIPSSNVNSIQFLIPLAVLAKVSGLTLFFGATKRSGITTSTLSLMTYRIR